MQAAAELNKKMTDEEAIFRGNDSNTTGITTSFRRLFQTSATSHWAQPESTASSEKIFSTYRESAILRGAAYCPIPRDFENLTGAGLEHYLFFLICLSERSDYMWSPLCAHDHFPLKDSGLAAGLLKGRISGETLVTHTRTDSSGASCSLFLYQKSL